MATYWFEAFLTPTITAIGVQTLSFLYLFLVSTVPATWSLDIQRTNIRSSAVFNLTCTISPECRCIVSFVIGFLLHACFLPSLPCTASFFGPLSLPFTSERFFLSAAPVVWNINSHFVVHFYNLDLKHIRWELSVCFFSLSSFLPFWTPNVLSFLFSTIARQPPTFYLYIFVLLGACRLHSHSLSLRLVRPFILQWMRILYTTNEEPLVGNKRRHVVRHLVLGL